MERFETIPFPLQLKARIFNINNPEEVLNGAVPMLEEIGPYIYNLYQTREIVNLEDDNITYIIHERLEFDSEASYPHTEKDNVMIINVPYNAILQVAEKLMPDLLALMNGALPTIFGAYSDPIITISVQDLLFNGIPICAGRNLGIVAAIACNTIRDIGAESQNMELQEDGSLLFSILSYKEAIPSKEYVVYRGIEDHKQLGEIITFNDSPYLTYWSNDKIPEGANGSICNQVNGTDSAIFAPFVNTSRPIYALNTDICRSVELRYEKDTEYQEVPAVRFVANEWYLDNDDGCFCLNDTTGITRDDGCLLKGAMELFTCMGAYMVLSNPHFLFADEIYQKGVIGLKPHEESHKIYMDIEPNTGVPVRGFKRAQFNIFSRALRGITATSKLNTTLMPVLWIEEGINLPDHLIDEIKSKLLSQLRLIEILVPVLISISAVILVVGIVLVFVAKCRKPSGPVFAN